MSREGVNKGTLLGPGDLISTLFLDMIRQFLMALFMAGICLRPAQPCPPLADHPYREGVRMCFDSWSLPALSSWYWGRSSCWSAW
jgi:hypothetical protein